MLRTIVGSAGVCFAVLVCFLPAASPAPPQDPSSPSELAISPHRGFLDTYCVTCHNVIQQSAGLTLDTMDVEECRRPGPRSGKRFLEKLRTNAMPPANMARPDEGARDEFVTYLETELDRAGAARPNPGRPALQRLNRTEYTNAIRDLLAIDIDAIDIGSLLPADDASYGFDNIGGALTVSPTLMEAYMSASRKISRLAIGDALSPPVSRDIRNSQVHDAGSPHE